MSLRESIHGLESAIERLYRALRHKSLDELVADFAKERGADKLGPRSFLFHTGYGPVHVKVVHDGPVDAEIAGKFSNPVGAERAKKDKLCAEHGDFRIHSHRDREGGESGLASWKRLMRRIGAASPAKPSASPKKWMRSTKVESLLFERPRYTSKDVRAWVKVHPEFHVKYGLDVKPNTIRVRQIPPSRFRDGHIRTKVFGRGIKAVIGSPR